jgi:hypothetical protein
VGTSTTGNTAAGSREVPGPGARSRAYGWYVSRPAASALLPALLLGAVALPAPASAHNLAIADRSLAHAREAPVGTLTVEATRSRSRPSGRASGDAGAVAVLAAALAGVIAAGWLASRRRQRATRAPSPSRDTPAAEGPD